MNSPRPGLVDSHAHLDSEQFGDEVDEVIARAVDAGVTRIINIGYRPTRWKTTIDLAARFPDLIDVTFGLHPHHAEEWSPETERELRALLAARRPLAIGEIGLDFNRNLNPPELQANVFRRQVAIAVEFGLPVVIHQRDAEDTLIEILRQFPSSLACVLHCYEGSTNVANFAIERGYYLGIGGLITRSKSVALRESVTKIPRELLLLETDAPYLVPAKVKNQRNEPAYLVRTAETLSALIGVTLSELSSLTAANAERVFGSPGAVHRMA